MEDDKIPYNGLSKKIYPIPFINKYHRVGKMFEKEIDCPVCHNTYTVGHYNSAIPIWPIWTLEVRCETCKYNFRLLSPIIISLLLLLIPLSFAYLISLKLSPIKSIYGFFISGIIAFSLYFIYRLFSIKFVNEEKINEKILSFHR